MTKIEIDKKVREYYQQIIKTYKNYKVGNLDEANFEVVNRCLDYWMSLKKQNEQLELELM